MGGWRDTEPAYLSKSCEQGLHDICTGFSPVNAELCGCRSCACRTRVVDERRAEVDRTNRVLIAAAERVFGARAEGA